MRHGRWGGCLLWMLAACNSAAPLKSGEMPCDSKQMCPAGYHCASDGKCWKDGEEPPPDQLMTAMDKSTPADQVMSSQDQTMSMGDLVMAAADLTPAPNDMVRVADM